MRKCLLDAFILILSVFQSTPYTQSAEANLDLEAYFASDTHFTAVNRIESSILVDLRYAQNDNAFHEKLYDHLEHCYLAPEAAAALLRAQVLLEKLHPGYRLIVYDCARPLHIQKKMRMLLKSTGKQGYVADPSEGSMHNYGLAVDVSIVDDTGMPLDMATDFDAFVKLSYPRLEDAFLKSGKLTQTQYDNRRKLRKIMYRAGFRAIANEWWHFYFPVVKGELHRRYPRIP